MKESMNDIYCFCKFLVFFALFGTYLQAVDQLLRGKDA
jgi:hypothetical protein